MVGGESHVRWNPRRAASDRRGVVAAWPTRLEWQDAGGTVD